MHFPARQRAASIAFALIAAFLLVSITGLVRPRHWQTLPGFDSDTLAVIRFTLIQAILSVLLSVIPALFVARALIHLRNQTMVRILTGLFAIPFALPPIVAIIALLGLFGRAGLLGDLFAMFDLPRPTGIFGLTGILLAHVFFNFPPATLAFYNALQTVPANQWRMASQLGLSQVTIFRLIEWPTLLRTLPGIACLVFMLCLTSFTIVLTLGGGPKSTSLELAIYQALRFELDLPRALLYTCLQLVLALAALCLLWWINPAEQRDQTTSAIPSLHLSKTIASTTINGLLIAIAALFVISPLLIIIINGLSADIFGLMKQTSVHTAILTSLLIGFCAALVSTSLSLAITFGRYQWAQSSSQTARLADLMPNLIFSIPPIVIGAGWFVSLGTWRDSAPAIALIVVLANALAAMPFAIRLLRPAVDTHLNKSDRLATSLAITGWSRFSGIDWPALRPSIVTAFTISMALSLGDLGVIALFDKGVIQTLPYLIYDRLGAYRTDDAAGLALILTVLCFALITLGGQKWRTHLQ